MEMIIFVKNAYIFDILFKCILNISDFNGFPSLICKLSDRQTACGSVFSYFRFLIG